MVWFPHSAPWRPCSGLRGSEAGVRAAGLRGELAQCLLAPRAAEAPGGEQGQGLRG